MQKAIIIGASSGIGRDLSKQLASQGYRIAIMARRMSLLKSLYNELPDNTLIEQTDVSKPEAACIALSKLIDELDGVDLIVFAAGYGELNETLDWKIEQQTIQTNIIGFTAIANVAIKHFIKKESGQLLAISSIAAIRGGKTAPAYNASKAFICNYLEGLRQKVTHLGLPIIITDVQPGFVDTAMAKGEGLFWVSTEKKAAQQIASAIIKGKSHTYVSKRWRLIAWLLKIMPNSLYQRL